MPGRPDLAATYLANNLSCLLRQQDVEDLKIKVDTRPSDTPQLRTLLGLIGNNLSRYREVQVTDTGRQANFVLRGETHMIQADLYQVWVILHPVDSGVHLAGMDTPPTSVPRLPLTAPASAARNGKHSDMQPVIARMELVRHANSDTAIGTLAATDSAVARCWKWMSSRLTRCLLLHTAAKTASVSCPVPVTALSPHRHVRAGMRTDFPEARFTPSDWPTVYAIAVSGADSGTAVASVAAGAA